MAISETSKAHKLSACASRWPRRVFQSKSRSAKPIARNTVAVTGDIRPGKYVATAPGGSLNNSWSIRKFRPNRYSLSVAAPISVTSKARKRAMWPLRVRDSPGSSNHKDVPKNAKPSAVLAFITRDPGRMDFNNSMWNAQPHRLTHPNTTAAMAVASQYTRRSLKRRASRSDIEAPDILGDHPSDEHGQKPALNS